MKPLIYTLITVVGTTLTGFAEEADQSQTKPQKEIPSLVDHEGFLVMSEVALKYRESRLVNLDKFNAMAMEPKTIILDTRSKWAYEAFHIKGAIHMSFSDFTASKLAKLIPDKNTRILIYCNNNFDAPKKPAIESKRAELALNIPTFINLYGYGFKNLYELSETVKVTDKRLEYMGVK